MKDFIFAAMPFVIVGICIAIICANAKKEDLKDTKNCLTEGMCIGMCLGVALSTSLQINLGLGVSLGMLIGETIGMFIKKKENSSDK